MQCSMKIPVVTPLNPSAHSRVTSDVTRCIPFPFWGSVLDVSAWNCRHRVAVSAVRLMGSFSTVVNSQGLLPRHLISSRQGEVCDQDASCSALVTMTRKIIGKSCFRLFVVTAFMNSKLNDHVDTLYPFIPLHRLIVLSITLHLSTTSHPSTTRQSLRNFIATLFHPTLLVKVHPGVYQQLAC